MATKRIANPWGQQHLTRRDWHALAYAFGLEPQDLKQFAAEQQTKADKAADKRRKYG